MVGDRGSVETVSRPAIRQIRLAVAAASVQRSRKLSGQGDVRFRFVVRLVAFATNIPVNRINSPERGSTDVSRARHLAMYLLHTKLSLPFSEIARQFGRDRTTIAHACSAIEDLRDIPERDDFVADLETMLDLALSMTPASLHSVRFLVAAE